MTMDPKWAFRIEDRWTEIIPITVDNQHEDGLLRTWITYLNLATELALTRRKKLSQAYLTQAVTRVKEK